MPLSRITADAVATALFNSWIPLYGAPLLLLSGNGSTCVAHTD